MKMPFTDYAINFAVPLAVAALMAIAILVTPKAGAVYNPSQNPGGTYGKVQISAATATKIPTLGLAGRDGLVVQNRDSASIFCGWDTAVTTANGIEVTSGTVQTFEIGFSGTPATPPNTLYCYSLSGQTSPADTRYMEIR